MLTKSKTKPRALTGAEAAAEAMRQISPGVVAVYPITPSTPIIETFAKMVADGKVETEFIPVESEHSALSAVMGASAAGVRAMTATSSQGLALMHEILYVTSGLRLPVVMNVGNRALSAPINIHCDHSDTMAERDSGWLQFYAENPQEVYDLNFIALRIAENFKVRLPAMVSQDGFLTTHSLEAVYLWPDEVIQKFIGEFDGGHHPLLDINHPVTVGPFDLYDSYFEHKRAEVEGMEKAREVIKKVSKEYASLGGGTYDFLSPYKLSDAQYAIVAMSSVCGTIRYLVDKLRSRGKKVGLLKIQVFRPFPAQQIVEALKHLKRVAVLDRAISFGAQVGPLASEVRSAFYGQKKQPQILNYIFGLGGRECGPELIEQVFRELSKEKIEAERVRYLGI